jgi:cytochrome c1
MSATKVAMRSVVFLLLGSCAAASDDHELGRHTLVSVGCTGCHQIPGAGTPGADSGPPLDQIGSRAYLAGVLPNTRENLTRWITRPQEVHPGDAMPDTEMSESEAGAVAEYLQSLK